MTYAKIAIMQKNSASDANAAASSITARNMQASSDKNERGT